MPLTFIDTNKLPKQASNAGEVTEVLNQDLCGAENVHGSLRWLKPNEKFQPDGAGKHQLIYLMEGKGRVRLDSKDYDVEKGMGIYLGPTDTMSIEASNDSKLKLFHLVVPKIPQ